MNPQASQDQDPPKAVVAGELFVEWPTDLYIPPDALEIFLERFQGPLDLLLYLIRKQNLDILDIPVAQITEQYMQYVEMMRTVNLDLAAEYLVMAATLAEIKARMLVPRHGDADEDEEDPRAALIRRLQEYERFRGVALEISEMPRVGREIFLVAADVNDPDPPVQIPKVALDDLAKAFQNVIDLAQRNQRLLIGREVLSVRERMTLILKQLQGVEFVRFEEFFQLNEGRMGLVVTFVAILELSKEHMIVIVQNEAYAPIHIQVAA